ncbi:hypothetical protein P7C70_g5514, partial [Phenoliferia sp. Uapishka_3]
MVSSSAVLSLSAALVIAWVVNRLINFTRNFSRIRSYPHTFTYFPAFEIINQLCPSFMCFDAPEVWATKFDHAGAIKQVGSQPLVFGKPLEIYQVVCAWGNNLVASENAEWKRHRKIVAPTFNEANNRLVWRECLRTCDEWFAIMDESVGGEEGKLYDDLDITASTMRLALLVISSAAFGKALPWVDQPLGKEDKTGHTMTFGRSLAGLMEEFVIRILAPNWAYYLPIEKLQKTDAYYREFETYMKEMIAERRAEMSGGAEINDLFSILIKSSDAEEGSAALSEREMLSNIYVILLAVTQTQATPTSVPSFVSFEVKFAHGIQSSNSVNFTQKYSTACFYETLRLVPPLLTIPKRALTDTTLTIQSLSPDGSPTPAQVFVPAGTNVRLDVQALHHNALYWGDDPTSFNPERFIDTEEKKWNRDAFVPFAVGQRACIGRSFAVVEATVVLSKILLHYEIRVPESLKEKYARRPTESEDERFRRIYKAHAAVAGRWLLVVLLIVAVILLSVFRDNIVDAIEPHKTAIVNTPATWLIPIAILILLSFPPLFGHEVVHVVIGLLWGLWKGFVIASAGTLLGEAACYAVFRFFLTAKAKKLEQSNTAYACLAKLLAQGNLGILTLIRYSFIPGHVVTALESTVGVNVLIYLSAVILSLPTQFALVYIGVTFGTTSSDSSSSEERKQRIISFIIFILTVLASWIAYEMILTRSIRFYPEVKAEQRKRTEMAEGGDEESQLGHTRSSSTDNLVMAEVDPSLAFTIPLAYNPPAFPAPYHPDGRGFESVEILPSQPVANPSQAEVGGPGREWVPFSGGEGAQERSFV